MMAFALLGLLGIGLIFWADGSDDSDTDTPEENENGLTRFDGTDEDDQILGTDGADRMLAEDGQDLLAGLDGDDLLNGGDGDDLLIGNKGDDTLRGADGDDILIGGAGVDSLIGGDGDDLIYSAEFVDDEALVEILGRDQPTTYEELEEIDRDIVQALSPDGKTGVVEEGDIVSGGDGEDLIVAGNGDSIASGDGEDLIVLGDWLEGGAPVVVTDHDPENQDIYEFSYAAGSTEPTLTFDLDEDGHAHVYADGAEVLIVQNAGEDFSLGIFSTSQRAA
ncbi:calcium-binding protein [Pseudooceanicola nanhaiensis]|uniref:calcium-binding protein n=1 Tax=Pseudooceanicola nanhaiensis TaxID=375761 RepID=UPI001CD56212|nr:calcium-binding protein [Pseudooceanicola nanhaiensis]MCA0920013.1 hypothetical protein [Pseudooceanicola nanhaiensis]